MSVIQSIKRAVGMEDSTPTYECGDCGERFQSGADRNSMWFQCPECSSEDARRVEE